jgi:3-oxoacyl-[acyl-carrier protein] reductase
VGTIHPTQGDPVKLKGKVAVVTGAGRGIGKVIATAFAREGAQLALSARTLTEVETAVSEITPRHQRGIAIQADLSNQQDVESMTVRVLAEFGRIDILVNNAGVQRPIGPLWENDVDDWFRALRINVGCVFLCCRSIIPIMIRQGGGKIINLSGGGAASSRPYFTAYAASKAATVRVTESLADELKGYNIQVNAIAPGGTYTRMTEEVLAAGKAAGAKALAEATAIKSQAKEPVEAAQLAVFLASDESGALSGRLISAAWDDWRSFPARLDSIISSDLYTLRRIT